jgi:hypothetical protein
LSCFRTASLVIAEAGLWVGKTAIVDGTSGNCGAAGKVVATGTAVATGIGTIVGAQVVRKKEPVLTSAARKNSRRVSLLMMDRLTPCIIPLC